MASPLHRLISWLYPMQLEKTRGELNHELEVNVHNGKVLLDSGNVNYSFGSLQDVFDRAFEKTGLYDLPLQSALILGSGSGSVAELLLDKCEPEMKIIGVEADSEVIRLGKKHFRVMRNPNFVTVHADATTYLAGATEKSDLIVVDVFIEDIVPGACQSLDFLRKVKSLLNKNGRLYFNKMKVNNDAITVDDLEKNLRSVFSKVKAMQFHLGGGHNKIFMAGA